MGKSPGKWIKTLLFGKKSRSHATKGRESGKPTDVEGFAEGNGNPASSVSPPVISESMLVSSTSNGVIPSMKKEIPSNLASDAVAEPDNNNGHGREAVMSIASEDSRDLIEVHAATKAQAVFRGFLARRAFHALKGIIKLQALSRGYLVRRQAVVTLRAMDGIIKLQALARGAKESKDLDSFRIKFANHMFVCKLLSSSSVMKPLQIEYDRGDPNSVYSWLERWTLTSLRKPLSQSKELIDSQTRITRASYPMENESGKSKLNALRTSAFNVDPSHPNAISDPEIEKTRRSQKKVLGSVKPLQEQPHSELEKVKRNLRKITSTPSEIPHEGTEEAMEEKLNSTGLLNETVCNNENDSEFLIPEKSVLSDKQSSNEMQPFQQIDNGSTLKKIGDIEEVYNENQKITKGRSSFSAKSQYAENGLANNTVLPSYMAATESAKAKLRGQMSPRFVSDSVDKNGFARRHSLPSSANGKLLSHAPHTQNLVQSNGKGVLRSDGTLLSSRGANERAIQVEWRR